MERRKRQTLARAYFERKNISTHHIRSFNRFLDADLQTIVDQKEAIQTSIGNSDTEDEPDGESNDEPLIARLDEIRFESPQVRESDGTVNLIYPQEARHRNLTYASPMYLHIQLITGGNQEPKSVFRESEVKIGELPIMVRSEGCNLNGLSATERLHYNEDPIDPGGYFIVNGNERALMSTEDLAMNRILTSFEQGSSDQYPVAKTHSSHKGYRNITTVVYDRNSRLTVSFPGVPGTLAFTTVIRALDLETDNEIQQHFDDDGQIMRLLLASLEDGDVRDRDTALNEIGSKVAPRQSSEYQHDRAAKIIEQRLLPHLSKPQDQTTGGRHAKAIHLCRMAQACFKLHLGRCDPDDKDHYKHKRVQLAGDLMRDQFRAILNRFGRDLKYQIERAYKRDRGLAISNLIQSDLIGNRLTTALATGNWVGGRSGVSQFVDRTNMLSLISQLRRVQTPLSRSRPHFDARELHATHWGRICPSETPEGPNCGLVKHLAQANDLSVIEPEEHSVVKELISMGVQQTEQHPTER